MKKIIVIVFMSLLLLNVSACTVDQDQEERTMRISVKSEQYEIIYELNDSTVAEQLYEQLPLTTEVEPLSLIHI